MKQRFTSYTATAGLFLAFALVLPASAQSDATAPEAPSDQKEAPGRGASTEATPKDEFAEIDTDRDGRISAQEYASSPRSAVDQVAAGERRGTAAPKGGFGLANNEGRPDRSKFFRKLDTNRDGYISREELQADGR